MPATSDGLRCESELGGFHDLALGGQLVLWGCRHWQQARLRDFDVSPCVARSFAAAELDLAFFSLCRMMAGLTHADAQLALAPANSPRLSAGDGFLIRLLAAAEPSAARSVHELLLERVAPGAVSNVVPHVHALHRGLAKRGMRILAATTSATLLAVSEPHPSFTSIRTH